MRIILIPYLPLYYGYVSMPNDWLTMATNNLNLYWFIPEIASGVRVWPYSKTAVTFGLYYLKTLNVFSFFIM